MGLSIRDAKARFTEPAMVRGAFGRDGTDVELPPDFEDPAFNRQLLGLAVPERKG